MEFKIDLSLDEIKKVLCKQCRAAVQALMDQQEDQIKHDFEAWRKSQPRRRH